MKIKVIRIVFVSVYLLFTTISCLNDTYDIPELTSNEPDIPLSKITTFQAVKSRLEQAQKDGHSIAVLDSDEELYIVGYVISSDRSGNFFEELVIQNKTDDSHSNENPRLGFRLPINASSLNDIYEVGRKVYVKLNGLTIGDSNGVLNIGKGEGSEVKQIQAYEFKDIILRSTEIATIIPKKTSALSLTGADLNTFIQLDDVQFDKDELMLTYAGEARDDFDGLRTLVSCVDNTRIVLQTSTFSDFKSLQIAQKRGVVSGVLSRSFKDEFNVLKVNSTANIHFVNDQRCDPIELSCGIADMQGAKNLFADDFETQTTRTFISGNGWVNYIESGTQGWEAYTDSGTNASLGISARVGSLLSNDASSIAWLITPAIDFDTHDHETLVFKTSNSFSDGSHLTLLFSADWDGTESGVSLASWGVLKEGYITHDDDSFTSWFDSGIVDLSCVTGSAYIAFKYTGSGHSEFDGTYELDDISIDY